MMSYLYQRNRRKNSYYVFLSLRETFDEAYENFEDTLQSIPTPNDS